MEIAQEIKKIIKGDVSDDRAVLDADSRDASIFRVEPQLIVYPKDVEDICALVKYVEEKKKSGVNISLTARSAGTDMTGGPLTSSIVLDMTRYFNKIILVGDNQAVVQPGVYYRDFEKETLKQKLLLPSYPASRELCTVGGMVANNSGGELNLNYGKTENYITKLKVVLRDGEEHIFTSLNSEELKKKESESGIEADIYRRIHKIIEDNYDDIKNAKPDVSKNSAGYYLWNVWNKDKNVFDINKLIVGSQGTFGIITEITFRLVKPKTYRHLVIAYLNDINIVPSIVDDVLAYKPESFESFDDNTFKIAMKFLPAVIKRMKGNFIKLAFSFLPEVWLMFTGGIPKLLLMAEFSGDTDKEALDLALKARDVFKKYGLKTKVTSLTEEKEYWVFRRESFNLLRSKIKNMHTAPFIDDFSVRPEKLSDFFPKLYKILDRYKILYTVAGHIGDGNFHIIPLMKLEDPKTKPIIEELSKKVYELVVSYHGTITSEHNDGLIRSPYLELMYGKKIVGLFEQTKDIFDPDNIFNPGKKVRSSWKYAMEHLDVPSGQ
jgi:FAD/FMN-containing dehydrogenase